MTKFLNRYREKETVLFVATPRQELLSTETSELSLLKEEDTAELHRWEQLDITFWMNF
jgi:hypothetical protein